MAANKVDLSGKTILDLTGDSVTPDAMLEGVTAHNAAGEPISGRLKGGAYKIAATDNVDGSQNLAIVDAVSGGDAEGSKTVTFSGGGAGTVADIYYALDGAMQTAKIGATSPSSVELTVDSGTTIFVDASNQLEAWYPAAEGASLLPGAILSNSAKIVTVRAMYKLD